MFSFQDLPPPLSSYVQNSSTSLALDVPSLQMRTNQLKENNPRMTIMLSGLSFRSALVLSVKWLILSGFPLTSFHLAEGNVVPWPILRKLRIPFSRCSYGEKLSLGEDWAETSLTTFSWLYILVCAVVQKYRKMFYLLNLKTYINYGTTTAPCTWMNKIKQKQNKNQNKARHIQIEHAFYCSS